MKDARKDIEEPAEIAINFNESRIVKIHVFDDINKPRWGLDVLENKKQPFMSDARESTSEVEEGSDGQRGHSRRGQQITRVKFSNTGGTHRVDPGIAVNVDYILNQLPARDKPSLKG